MNWDWFITQRKKLKMNKAQCYIFSTLSIAMALTFSFPLAMATKPIIGVILGSALIGIGGIFFLIGVNKC